MSFIKEKHNNLFKQNLDNIFASRGENVTFYLKNVSKADCTWCYFDSYTGRSSNKETGANAAVTGTQDIVVALGFDLTPYWLGQWMTAAGGSRAWTNHPDYKTPLICPECGGLGYTSYSTTVIVPNVFVYDIKEDSKLNLKPGFKMTGSKILLGKLLPVLSDSTNVNSKTIFETAFKFKVQGNYYKLLYLKRIGLKDIYIYEAFIIRVFNQFE